MACCSIATLAGTSGAMTAALQWMNVIGVGAPTALRSAATTASGCGLRLRSTAVIGKPQRFRSEAPASCAFQSPLSGLATSSCVAALARSHCATTLCPDTVGHLAVGIDPNGHEIAAPDLLVHHRPKHRVPLVGLTNFGLRFRFSNHDLTPHLQNYRNHLQNLRLLGAQIVVPIVLQG